MGRFSRGVSCAGDAAAADDGVGAGAGDETGPSCAETAPVVSITRIAVYSRATRRIRNRSTQCLDAPGGIRLLPGLARLGRRTPQVASGIPSKDCTTRTRGTVNYWA